MAEESKYEAIVPIAGTDIYFLKNKNTIGYVSTHWHNHIEIIYILKGSLFIDVQRYKRVLHAGDCIVINEHEPHSTRCDNYNESILVQIPCEFIERYYTNIHHVRLYIPDVPQAEGQKEALCQVRRLLSEMAACNESSTFVSNFHFNSLLFELLYVIFNHFLVHQNVTQTVSNLDRIIPILEYSVKHHAEKITLDKISRVASLQKEYFCRYFKKCMGITYFDYLNELRISLVYQDLLNTEKSITDILQDHGFSNNNVFRRRFHNFFHATPSQVRKKRNEN